MNNGAKLIIAVVVVAVIGLGAFLLTKDDTKNDQTTQQNTSQDGGQNQAGEQGSATEEIAATITYDGSSFTSSVDTVKSGSKVKVVNSSQDDLDFDSNPHPVHTDNPELNVGDIAPGESMTFTLSTKGTWGFHNHLNSGQHGEITVE